MLNNLTVKHGKPFKEKTFRRKGCFKPKTDSKRSEGLRTYQNQLLPLEGGPAVAGKISTTSVKEGHGGVESETRTVKILNVRLNNLCETPLIHKSRPLFFATGKIRVDGETISTRRMLPDCGATAIYVSKRGVNKHQLETKKFEDKNIRVKHGNNQLVETEIEKVPAKISGLAEVYKCVAVVYATPDEFVRFPCFEGILTGEIDKSKEQHRRFCAGNDRRDLWIDRGRSTGDCLRASEICRSERPFSEKAGTDSCQAAALETDVVYAVKLVRDTVQKQGASAGKRSTGNGDSESSKRESTAGRVQTKYIRRKKLNKFLRIKIKSIHEPDFMLVLSNETIKRVARTLHRQDQLANVVTTQAKRYLETDWESFQDNPAFKLLIEYAMEYMNKVFRRNYLTIYRRNARSITGSMRRI
ncbi:Hypothetical protein PHPALM_3139 [Phytophthora palmivora]|uniref:Uncharacterized protein n=1 Tax=Phytophthora palmivora TaxID=4796 RepID=A0A2P4YN48_9STRA|nr:Hypothetical protein PHPALM_3139 [Phytophthora palmivora]